VQIPATEYKHQQITKPGKANSQARLRLEPTHRTHNTQAFAGLQSAFYVMVFAAHTLALLYFFANKAVVFKKVFAKK
jgi:hypothetical protein